MVGVSGSVRLGTIRFLRVGVFLDDKLKLSVNGSLPIYEIYEKGKRSFPIKVSSAFSKVVTAKINAAAKPF